MKTATDAKKNKDFLTIVDNIKNEDIHNLNETINKLENHFKTLEKKTDSINIIGSITKFSIVAFIFGAILGYILGSIKPEKVKVRYYTHRCSYYFKK